MYSIGLKYIIIKLTGRT